MPEFAHEAVLDRILDSAAQITGARFAALGILDEEGTEFAEFRTARLERTTYTSATIARP